MTTPVALPGLRASSPAAALALYGLAVVLDGTVGWAAHGEGWQAQVAVPGCASVDDVATLVVTRCRERPADAVLGLAKDVNELVPAQWREGIERDDAVAQVVAGLSAEAPLRSAGQVALSPACVYSFGTRGTLFGNVAKQEHELDATAVHALLSGPWVARRGVNTLGLDSGARRQDGATMGPDPSADGVRGVPGLVPLAVRGLAAVAPMPGPRATRGGAFVRDSSGVELRWPVFAEAVRGSQIALIANRDWAARSPAQRQAAGVEAVYASRVLRAERRLAEGRRVA